MEEASWDVDKALELAMERSAIAPHLRDEVLAAGWRTLLSNLASNEREAHIRRVTAGVDSAARIREVARHSVLETYLIGSIPLGRATADDLRRSIGIRKANAETERQRADFETSVLKRMKPGKTVAACLTPDEVEQIMRGIFK